MSCWRCPNCKELHSTTGTPNKIEGYFLSDLVVETTQPRRDRDNILEMLSWAGEYGIPANRCPACKTITPQEVDDE